MSLGGLERPSIFFRTSYGPEVKEEPAPLQFGNSSTRTDPPLYRAPRSSVPVYSQHSPFGGSDSQGGNARNVPDRNVISKTPQEHIAPSETLRLLETKISLCLEMLVESNRKQEKVGNFGW
jgi:hypothetical protein